MSSAGKKDKGKLPVLDKLKAADMNMMVLKRIDAQIEEIIASAAHVCLYRMSVNEQQWQRKNIEGSLFLIKRRTQPRFQMLVLNKLSTDNYIETVHGGLEMETNPPYLMYTHGNDEIHGIWFYDESDLHHLAGLLQKILNQLPRPEDGAAAAAAAAAAQQQQQQQHYQPAPLPAVQEPQQQPAAAGSAAGAAGEGDAFWDRSVHVTEDTLPASQQLVPNSSLISEPSAGAVGGAMGGLQGLLKAAQQKHNVAQRASSASSSQQLPLPAAATSPIPNSSSIPAESATPAPPSMLLTPAFFEQQKAKQQQAAPAPAAAAAASPVPAAAAAGGSSNSGAAAQQPPAAVNGGGAASGSALHQLLSRAAKQTPSGPSPSAAAAAAAAGAGSAAARGQPQPPIGVLSPEAIREKVKTALIRLANNDAFVDSLAQELKTVGLLQ